MGEAQDVKITMKFILEELWPKRRVSVKAKCYGAVLTAVDNAPSFYTMSEMIYDQFVSPLCLP